MGENDMKFRRLGKELWDISKIPPGLQLYTLRNQTQKDFIGTLKKVADIGYKTIEFAGYGDISAVQMKKALDDFGLLGVSTHVSFEKLEKELERQIEYSKVIGSQFIIVPYIPKEIWNSDSQFQTLISALKKIGKEIKRSGLQLGYHNHEHEFVKVGGRYILDRLLEGVGKDLLVLELDLYWIKKAGLDPKSILRYYAGQVPLVHVKDMDKRGEFTEVGKGIMDYPSIFPLFHDVGIKYYFVEQDISQHPLKSVKLSIDYLKEMGLA